MALSGASPWSVARGGGQRRPSLAAPPARPLLTLAAPDVDGSACRTNYRRPRSGTPSASGQVWREFQAPEFGVTFRLRSPN